MARRLAAVSALVLAALALSPAARAQGFFQFSEASPRDVLSRLDDEGYSARLPMIRRGDVYIVDARTSSGRSVRLIVSARDGDILERYAATPRYEDYGRVRGGDEEPFYRRRDDDFVDRPDRRPQSAFADPSEPRVLNFDGGDRMVPPAAIPDGAPARSRRHVAKKPVAKDAPEPAVAAVAPSDPKVSDPKVSDPKTSESKPSDVRPTSPKIIELSPIRPIAAPAKPEPKVSPPPVQAKVEAPKSVTPKPATPRIVGEPITTAMPKAEEKPAPVAEAPKPVPAQAHAEEKPAPRKKINDLPVGTLD